MYFFKLVLVLFMILYFVSTFSFSTLQHFLLSIGAGYGILLLNVFVGLSIS